MLGVITAGKSPVLLGINIHQAQLDHTTLPCLICPGTPGKSLSTTSSPVGTVCFSTTTVVNGVLSIHVHVPSLLLPRTAGSLEYHSTATTPVCAGLISPS